MSTTYWWTSKHLNYGTEVTRIYGTLLQPVIRQLTVCKQVIAQVSTSIFIELQKSGSANRTTLLPAQAYLPLQHAEIFKAGMQSNAKIKEETVYLTCLHCHSKYSCLFCLLTSKALHPLKSDAKPLASLT